MMTKRWSFAACFVAVLCLCSLTIYYFCVNKSRESYIKNEILENVSLLDEFNKYLDKFGKKYGPKEHIVRFRHYKESLKTIELLNKESKGVKYGITKFADMSEEEFKKISNTVTINEPTPVSKSCVDNYTINEDLNIGKIPPAKFDWRDKGVVGPVLSQLDPACSACWAFSIVGVVEALAVIDHKNPFTSLSVQEVIDVSPSQCGGGNIETVSNVLCHCKVPLTTAEAYPLTLRNQSYRAVKQGWALERFDIDVDQNSTQVATRVAFEAPVATLVDSYNWRYYIDGVIQYRCLSNFKALRHVVFIVGYNMDAEVPYYILKNSWGSDFGDNGYVKVAMHNFTCGVGKLIARYKTYYKH